MPLKRERRAVALQRQLGAVAERVGRGAQRGAACAVGTGGAARSPRPRGGGCICCNCGSSTSSWPAPRAACAGRLHQRTARPTRNTTEHRHDDDQAARSRGARARQTAAGRWRASRAPGGSVRRCRWLMGSSGGGRARLKTSRPSGVDVPAGRTQPAAEALDLVVAPAGRRQRQLARLEAQVLDRRPLVRPGRGGGLSTPRGRLRRASGGGAQRVGLALHLRRRSSMSARHLRVRGFSSACIALRRASISLRCARPTG